MIELQDGEAYLLFGKPHVGKTTYAFQLAAQKAKDKNIVYIPTEIYKGTLAKWEPIVRELYGYSGQTIIQQVEGWAPEENLQDLFRIFGEKVRIGLIPAKNKAGEEIYLRSFNVEKWGLFGSLDKDGEPQKRDKEGKPIPTNLIKWGQIKRLADEGERIFIFDSISAPVKAVFEFGADLTANLAPRDTCLSRLLHYTAKLCVTYGATVILIDHESQAPTNKYDKPKPYGPAALKYLAKYWLLLTQSDAKEHTDVHQLTFTRNVGAQEYSEQYWLRLSDKGFVDMGEDEVAALARRKKDAQEK